MKENYAKDNEWFTEHIIVKDKRIIVKVNDKVVVDYTEPDNFTPKENHIGRKIGSGNICYTGS